VAIALRESQLWLRSLTVKALREWVEASKLLSSEHKEVIKKNINAVTNRITNLMKSRYTGQLSVQPDNKC
jgi:hypothetical protein